MLVLHSARCIEYGTPGHPERATRISATVERLRAGHPDWIWREPPLAEAADLQRAHAESHLSRLREEKDHDADTPWFPDLFDHAVRASGAALAAATAAVAGEGPAVSLMRPPGHHATRDQAMGFCHLNHAAIAALALQARTGLRVAVWDFDAHHGNGTEAILRGVPNVLYASVHQFPAYPGTGIASAGNCRNWPVPPGATRERHREALDQSWEETVAFRPGLVIVSAGFDAHVDDPLTDMTLETEDFGVLGRWLRETGLPTAAILEGGYGEALPSLIDAFLSNWES